MNFYSIPNFIAAFILITLAIFVFARNSAIKINVVFSGVCLSGFIWLLSYAIAYNLTSDKDQALFWFKIGYIGILFIAVTFFHYTVILLRMKHLQPLIFLTYLWGGVSALLLWQTNKIIKGVGTYFWGLYPLSGTWHPLFLALFMLIICASSTLLFYSLFIHRNALPSFKYNQVKYTSFAFLIYSFASIDFLPNYGFQVFPCGFMPVAIFCAIIAYAIVKYRLMDINIIITRAAIFLCVYIMVLGIPFAIAFGLQGTLVKLFSGNWWIFPLVVSTFLATTGPFVYVVLNRKAEEKLLKQQRSYQNVLRNASAGMIRIKELKRLLNLVVHVVAKAVRVAHVSVYLFDSELNKFVLQCVRGSLKPGRDNRYIEIDSPVILQLMSDKNPIVTGEVTAKLADDHLNKTLFMMSQQLCDLNVALVVPSFVDERLTGILMLGEKISGKLYSDDDLLVFSVLANQAALAIENAQFYEEIKKTHEQLFQAEKLATIGTMADGLSHQINNRFHVLSLIAGDSLDILKNLQLDTCSEVLKSDIRHIQQSLEKIEQNVLQGGEIVKGLLKYSRPGQEGFQSLDLRTVVNGAMDMVQYKIKIKDIDVVVQIPTDLPRFMGNLTQLQEVFFNLVDNAYDATVERAGSLNEPGYRGRIQITASGEEGSLHVLVADNGIGVKDLDKKKMFTPFFTTKATSRKGTGLGLYVIEKILASHQGKIEIDSVYQRGTVFSIFLPWGQNILTS